MQGRASGRGRTRRTCRTGRWGRHPRVNPRQADLIPGTCAPRAAPPEAPCPMCMPVKLGCRTQLSRVKSHLDIDPAARPAQLFNPPTASATVPSNRPKSAIFRSRTGWLDDPAYLARGAGDRWARWGDVGQVTLGYTTLAAACWTGGFGGPRPWRRVASGSGVGRQTYSARGPRSISGPLLGRAVFSIPARTVVDGSAPARQVSRDWMPGLSRLIDGPLQPGLGCRSGVAESHRGGSGIRYRRAVLMFPRATFLGPF